MSVSVKPGMMSMEASIVRWSRRKLAMKYAIGVGRAPCHCEARGDPWAWAKPGAGQTISIAVRNGMGIASLRSQ